MKTKKSHNSSIEVIEAIHDVQQKRFSLQFLFCSSTFNSDVPSFFHPCMCVPVLKEQMIHKESQEYSGS